MAPRSRNPARTADPPKGVDQDTADDGLPAGTPRPWQWFVLSAAIPLMLSAAKLDLDLWHDEIYTIQSFVSRGVGTIVTDYSVPNNHILYSLLLRPFYLISDGDMMLRLPSLASTAGTLWIVFVLARRRAGLPAALLATSLVGLNQTFLVHTIQVRGYSLSMFLSAWLGWLALAAGEDSSRRRTVTIILAGAAFLYVLPTNLLFLAPMATVACALAWYRGETGIKATLAEAYTWLAAGLVAALFYMPMARQVLRAGGPDSGGAWAGAWQVHSGFLRYAAYDMLPLLVLSAIGLVCWAATRPRGQEAAGGVLVLWALSLVAGSFVLTGLFGIEPFERNYCPLLPPLALAAGWLLAQLTLAAHRWLAPKCPAELAAVLTLLVVWGVLVPKVLSYPQRLNEYRSQRFAQGGYYNYYAAGYNPSRVADYLQTRVVEDRPYYIAYEEHDHMNLSYYLARCHVPPYLGLGGSPSGAEAVVHVVVPPVTDYAAIEEKCGLPPGTIRQFPLVEDFGYYRLLRSPGRVRVRVAGVHRP